MTRKHISKNAQKVLSRLNGAGYEAYLVGGGVRDLLLGIKPKDFDIATDATPEQVKQLFKNCRLIGRRFRLAHVMFGRDIIEVATFRGHHKPEHQVKNKSESGMLLRDNVYGTIEEDVLRRDFTVNALYFSIKDHSIIDFVGGIEDIEARKLHLIGDTENRYREDPVRMIRAVRLATKLDLNIDEASQALIPQLASTLTGVPKARLWEEMLKLFLSGHAQASMECLNKLQLLPPLFPQTLATMEDNELAARFVSQALANTDLRIANNKTVTPAFLFAALLWHPLQEKLKALGVEENQYETTSKIASKVISEQCDHIAIPRRFSVIIKEIWMLQLRLPKRFGNRAQKLLSLPRFRAAYDFLLLREESGEQLDGLGQWWTEFQEADETEQRAMVSALRSGPGKKRKRRRKPSNRNRGDQGPKNTTSDGASE